MNQILTSIRGRLAGLTHENRLAVPAGFVSGERASNIMLPNPDVVVFFDDFLGDVVADQWNYVEGTDTTTADGAVVAGAAGGVFRLTGGDSAGSAAADMAQLTQYLNWQAAGGFLAIEARIKLSSIASVSVFMGFTDVVTLEAPVVSADSADTITTNASDAFGFLFDTDMATDNLLLVGVDSNTDATLQDSGVAPVAATYLTLRAELDSSGNATFFINGVQVGTRMASACSPDVGLTPTFSIYPNSATAGKTLDIDYVHMAMARV